MREIVVLSGKGGAGKTSLTAAFAALAERTVVCDLDVDAPDLHILLDPTDTLREDFLSGHEAVIDPDACTGCDLCRELCRFDAIDVANGTYAVDGKRCEGCKLCVAMCPSRAIAFPPRRCGFFALAETRFGPMAHARLDPGGENSGRLVALLKKKARELAATKGCDLVLCDGAPGIACPVISSLSGASLAVLVTEPTPSGTHDLKRVAELCDHFKVPVGVIVNKADLNRSQTEDIEALCREHGYTLLGRLPHDPAFTQAMVHKQTLTEYGGPLAGDIARLWNAVLTLAGLPADPKP
jgi:MinD superfamily P-loop ATPase